MNVPTLDEIKKELASRSLYEFVKQAWHVVEPGREFVDGKHIRLICELLEECRPDSLEGPKEFLINIPPRHMKSLLVAVFWPCWLWGPQNKPHIQFLFGSYALQLATRDNLKRRRLIQSPWYQARWGDRFQLAGDQSQKQKFENDHNGHMMVTSPDSAATGEGGDIVVCLRYNSLITTDAGLIPIGRIVEEKLPVRVLSFDHSTEAYTWNAIEAYETGPGRSSVKVTFSDGRYLEATSDHPIWANGRGYVKAAKLAPGDEVLFENKLYGESCQFVPWMSSVNAWWRRNRKTLGGLLVTSVESIGTPNAVYNIRVAVNHNYFASGVLVHNCDDPHNVKEARSEAERTNAINWWDQTMSTRLNDPKRGVRGIIMQRVHEMDLSGHVIQKGTYKHLCLPAEFEPNHPHRSSEDWRSEEGELLWPERIDRKGMDKLKRDLGSMGAAGQLQQRPSPAEGNIFKRAWFRYYDSPPEKFDKIIQSWDMSFKGAKDNDYVVGEVWGKLGVDLYLLDVVRKQMDFPTTCAAVLALSAKHPLATVKLIEEKANGAAVMAQLRDKVGGMIPVRPDVSKEARAAGVSPLYEAGNVFVPRYGAFTEEFIEEHINFPNAAHDDQVDAASQAVSYLNSGVPFRIIDLNNVADTEEEQPQTEEEQYLRLLQSDEAWSEF